MSLAPCHKISRGDEGADEVLTGTVKLSFANLHVLQVDGFSSGAHYGHRGYPGAPIRLGITTRSKTGVYKHRCFFSGVACQRSAL
jgi:hypothetical protein